MIAWLSSAGLTILITAGKNRGRALKRAMLSMLAVGLLAVSTNASAVVVYDNGSPDGLSGNESTQWIQAQDFSITDGASIDSAQVFLFGIDGISAWDGGLRYYFFSDNSSSPGTLLTSGNAANLSVTDTGVAGPIGGNIFSFLFDLQSPFAAAAGSVYWFGIHSAEDFIGIDFIYWGTSVQGGNGQESEGGTLDNWFSNDLEHAFNLRTQVAVPEPGTLMLLGLGLLGLGLTRRKAT